MPDTTKTNYDSTKVGVPYMRVNRIEINYPSAATANVVMSQTQCVMLADKSTIPMGEPSLLELALSPQDMGTKIHIVDPATGADSGQTTTIGAVMVGLVAVIRAKQTGEI